MSMAERAPVIYGLEFQVLNRPLWSFMILAELIGMCMSFLKRRQCNNASMMVLLNRKQHSIF